MWNYRWGFPKLFFMCGGAATGLWRQQTWWSSWILPVEKAERIGIFLRLIDMKNKTKVFCFILSTGFGFIAETSWKTCIFAREWLDHLLLMTSYLLTIVTDHYQTWLKMRAKDQQTATENVRCWLLTVWEWKELRKTLEKGGTHTHCLYVRGLRAETISSVVKDSKDRHGLKSLGLIIVRGRCVSGHVVRASLLAVRLGYVTGKHKACSRLRRGSCWVSL